MHNNCYRNFLLKPNRYIVSLYTLMIIFEIKSQYNVLQKKIYLECDVPVLQLCYLWIPPKLKKKKKRLIGFFLILDNFHV